MRLGLRATIGPWLGRRRFPLSHAFASYQGDTPGSPYYVNDLLAANGLRYVWLNMDDLHRNQIALPEVFENGRPTILRRVRMDDGTRYYRFERCYGKLPGRVGGEASLRESPEAYDTSVLITETNLRDLCLAEGTCILYTHWTHSRSLPLQESTLKRFALLQSWRDAGKIWAPPTSRLLEWTRRRTFLRVVSRREGKRLLVELDGIDDPLFGREPASLSDLDGLSLVLPSADQEITIVVGGEALEANHVHRSGKLCWLDAHGDLTAPKRETSSERQTCV